MMIEEHRIDYLCGQTALDCPPFPVDIWIERGNDWEPVEPQLAHCPKCGAPGDPADDPMVAFPEPEDPRIP